MQKNISIPVLVKNLVGVDQYFIGHTAYNPDIVYPLVYEGFDY